MCMTIDRWEHNKSLSVTSLASRYMTPYQDKYCKLILLTPSAKMPKH